MKILFPHGEVSKEEIEKVLRFAVEGRKRVKDQLMRIDSTYPGVRFGYLDASGKFRKVTTLEEQEYPRHYHQRLREEDDGAENEDKEPRVEAPPGSPEIGDEAVLKEQHLTIQENQKGISFDTLLGPYLRGASKITVTDPYIRLFYQTRNFMELLETIVNLKSPDEEVSVHLVTVEDDFRGEQQKENFEEIKESSSAVGIHFTWEFDGPGTIHARHIVTDHGWKILLDRGLDIFQPYEMNAAFAFSNRLQQYRQCKAFEVTFIKQDQDTVSEKLQQG